MTNLIPPDGVRVVRKEYAVRVLSVWAFVLAVAIGLSALMLLPTYVLISEQLRITDAEAAIEDDAHAIATSELEEAQAIADRLTVVRDPIAASVIVEHIERALAPEIKLRSLHIAPSGTDSTVQVVGVAMNRESLQRFIGRLKDDPFFRDASVPVSDLARDVDPPFVLTLVLAGSDS
jgi:hypothetical protein